MSAVHVGAAETQRFVATDQVVWFGEVEQSLTAEQRAVGLPADQRFGAEVADGDPTTYAGIYGVRPLQLSVPGGGSSTRQLPVAGITWVGVHPDQRRRGVLSAMIDDHFARTRAAGVVASGLHASEAAIYGRFGYGLASMGWELVLGRGERLTAPGLDAEAGLLRTVLTSIDDPGLADRLRRLDQALAAHAVGSAVFNEGYYVGAAHETPETRRGREATRLLFAVEDGVDVGVAEFWREHKWERARPDGRLRVQHLDGTPAARLALLRRLVDFDLVGSVRVPGVGDDDPLWSWLATPRSPSEAWRVDALWLRPIDLAAFLAARGYETDCSVVLEVADDRLPDNAGRWRFTARSGEGSLTRTDDASEVSVPVAALGAAYLGQGNLVAAHRAGRLVEHRPGAVRELWHAFRGDVAPVPTPVF